MTQAIVMFAVAAGVVGWAAFKIVSDERKRKRTMELREAIKKTLDAGLDVERESVHLFKRGTTYRLLKFGPKSQCDVDEFIGDFDQALNKFAHHSGLKLEV